MGAIADGRLFPEHRLAKGARQRTSEPLFKHYGALWLKGCQAKNLKRTTVLRYNGILNKHLFPVFGHLPLSAIDRAQVRQMASRLHVMELEPKTIHNILRTLSAIFSQANEDAIVSHNPATKPSKLVRLRKVGEHMEVYTHEEEVIILDKAKKHLPQYYPFILTLFRSGLREGEAVALTPEDLDLRNRYVVVERNFTAGHLEDSPKSGRRREVDLAQDLVGVLKEHLALQAAEAAMLDRPRPRWLFTSAQGEIIRSNNFRDRIWKPLLQEAEIRYRCVHAIRHTFATRLIMRGARLVYVQKQLGHSSIQITVDLYTHWIKRAERERTLEVDRLVEPPGHPEDGTFGGTRLISASEGTET